MCKVLNKRTWKYGQRFPVNAVYVARPSKWGNPFSVEKYGRKKAIELYRAWIYESGLIDDIFELKGKDLVCFCAPLPCHADYLLELANS